MHTNLGLLSLLPTFITILIAFTTRKVYLALFLGIMSGAFALKTSLIEGTLKFLEYLYKSFTDTERLKITFFVMMVAGILEIVAFTKANIKFGEWIGNFLKSKKRARLTAFGLSSALFFDDYANVLIAGAAMRPVMDKHKISPAFLAYLSDSLATLASIMIISTWAAFEISLIENATNSVHIAEKGSIIFFKTIPFYFYTFMNVFLVFLVSYSGKWFATKKDNGSGIIKKESTQKELKARKRDMIIPLVILITVAFFGMFIWGYIETPQNQSISIITILGNAPSIDVLNLSVIIAMISIIILMKKDKILPLKTILKAITTGMKGMFTTGLVIILAKGLEFCASDLGTGYYITDLFKNILSANYIPMFIFIVAALITVASGFSWSSMALVMPIAVQMASSHNTTIIYASVSAVISGAIFGAQLVPYSDKSIMTAAACGITPIYHIQTQLPQILLVGFIAIFAYFLLGLKIPIYIIFIIITTLLFFIHKFFSKEFSNIKQ
jgi:Na+/H+ antiporter NhaC